MPPVWKKTVFAPAKINLGLRILGKLPSGYHALQSILAPLDFGDTIHVEISEAAAETQVRLEVEFSIKLRTAFPELTLCSEQENLAYLAADRFCKRFLADDRLNVLLRLEKCVPWQAGLGGGSSDAAAVIRALVEYAASKGIALDSHVILSFGLELGADIPALLCGQICLVEGVGGQLTPLRYHSSLSSSIRLLVVKPPFSSPTSEAFERAGKAALEITDLEFEDGMGQGVDLSLFEKPCLRGRPILRFPQDWHAFTSSFVVKSLAENFDMGEVFTTNCPWETRSEQLTNPRSEVTSVLGSDKLAAICKMSNEFGDLLKEPYPILAKLEAFLLDRGAFHCLIAGSGSAIVAFFEGAKRDACREVGDELADFFSASFAAGDSEAGNLFIQEASLL